MKQTHCSQPFLSLQKATFRLGDSLVFEDTSLVIRRAEQWAVVGSNGSGKSLFADALSGRLPLVSGELNYHFRPPSCHPHGDAIALVRFDDRKEALGGAVLQSRWNSVEEEGMVRVRDFLSFERVMDVNPFEINKGRSIERKRFEQRLRRALRLLDVGRFMERRLESLSNGENQRVQLTRALSHPLRLLILDEPFIGLDVAYRTHLKATLEKLMNTSLKVVIITAREDDLPPGITHVARLEQCRIVDIRVFSKSTRKTAKSDQGEFSKAPRQPQQIQVSAKRNAATPRSLIELKNVCVRYGDKIILTRLSWRVEAGESWALLGPNGSGKTTLLSLIQGDHPQAYANQVIVFGKQRGAGESVWHLKKRIGTVSPELQVHFDESMTCFDAVASGFDDTIGLFRAVTARERKSTLHWLEYFGLSKFAREPLAVLSAGAQRLVLLARALVKSPPLLILDEPCQGLDAEHTAHFVQTVERLIATQATTVIYVTHREEEIPRSIKRMLRLESPRGAN